MCLVSYFRVSSVVRRTVKGNAVGDDSMNTPQDVTSACSHMRGIGLVFDSVTHRAVWAASAAETFSVGLMTSPTMAVVDIAAQDGLIGSIALSRLKEELRHATYESAGTWSRWSC